MSEIRIEQLPNILWKILDLNFPCVIESSPFLLQGVKVKLKLIYCTTQNSNGNRGTYVTYPARRSIILLSRCEKKNFKTGINVWVSLVKHCQSSIVVMNTECTTNFDEVTIWTLDDSELKQKDATYDLMKVIKQQYFFKVEMNVRNVWFGEDFREGPTKAEATPSICMTSFGQDIGSLFNNHSMSDVILQCGEEKIYAHKMILAARSDVFAAMFRGELREAKEGSLTVEDVEPPVLKQLIHYMYSGEILDLSSENAHKVYMAADKYNVEALKLKCGVFMTENQTEAEPSGSAAVAVETGEKAVLKYFSCINDLFQSDSWQKLSESQPHIIRQAYKLFIHQSP